MSRRWLPPILWAATILLLTSVPIPQDVAVPTGGDKLAHLGLYGVLGFLSLRAAWDPAAPGRALVLVVVMIAAFAGLDELHQELLASRSAELLDWYADVVGATLGGVLATIQLHVRERLS